MEANGLDSLLRADKGLVDLISFQIDYSNHLVPRSCEKAVVVQANESTTDRICKLENSHASSALIVPLSTGAVVGSGYQKVGLSSDDMVDSVRVAYQRSDEPLFIVGSHGERADEAVFISGVDLLVHEAEAANESVVPLPLHRARRIQDLLSWIVDDLHL